VSQGAPQPPATPGDSIDSSTGSKTRSELVQRVETALAELAAHDGVLLLDPYAIDKSLSFKREFHADAAFESCRAGTKTAEDFPTDEICRRLDGEPDEPPGATTAQPDTATALRLMLEWICAGKPRNDERFFVAVGTQAIAAYWVLNPSAFGGLSARALCEKLGNSHINFSRIASEFTERFGIRNHFQAHFHNRN